MKDFSNKDLMLKLPKPNKTEPYKPTVFSHRFRAWGIYKLIKYGRDNL